MQADEKCVKETHHKASFGLAPRRRTFVSRTTLSRREISAKNKLRPNPVIR